MYYRYAVIEVSPADEDDVAALQQLMLNDDQVRHVDSIASIRAAPVHLHTLPSPGRINGEADWDWDTPSSPIQL